MKKEVSGFQWDDGNWPKCGKHGLSKAQIEHVLSGQIWVYPDRTEPASEERFNAVGRSAEGRHVFVVFTFRIADGVRLIRPVSARYMHAKEVEHYEQQTKT